MKIWSSVPEGGWIVRDTDDDRRCETCKFWENHECANPESEYLESRMLPDERCDAWEEYGT
jgi:hypothetical protein